MLLRPCVFVFHRLMSTFHCRIRYKKYVCVCSRLQLCSCGSWSLWSRLRGEPRNREKSANSRAASAVGHILETAPKSALSIAIWYNCIVEVQSFTWGHSESWRYCKAYGPLDCYIEVTPKENSERWWSTNRVIIFPRQIEDLLLFHSSAGKTRALELLESAVIWRPRSSNSLDLILSAFFFPIVSISVRFGIIMYIPKWLNVHSIRTCMCRLKLLRDFRETVSPLGP